MEDARLPFSKVPAVTLAFWIVKVAATTLGETGGDTISMSLDLGYLIGCTVFAGPLAVLVASQIRARSFHPFLYWLTIVAATLFGTTAADFFDRSLGIGYTGGTLTVLACLLLTLGLWHWTRGTIAVETVRTPGTEIFYWVAITLSQTLGTALGDWTSSVAGLGFGGGAALFVSLLLAVALLYYTTSLSRTFLFWAAFILTRPLGATFGDLLDKSSAAGGYDISRPVITALLAVFMLVCLLLLPQRPSRPHGHA